MNFPTLIPDRQAGIKVKVDLITPKGWKAESTTEVGYILRLYIKKLQAIYLMLYKCWWKNCKNQKV